MTCRVLPRIKLAIQHEAIDRGMTLGELITEAFMRRETFAVAREPAETEEE